MPTNNQARRLSPEERRQQLLVLAVKLAEKHGYKNITGPQVAEAAGLRSHGLIWHYFGTVEALRGEIMGHAIKTGNSEILLQGLVVRDAAAMTAPQELKDQALSKLASE